MIGCYDDFLCLFWCLIDLKRGMRHTKRMGLDLMAQEF